MSAELELAIDLGDRIGSALWWRGLALLLLLCATAVALGQQRAYLLDAPPQPSNPADAAGRSALGLAPLALPAPEARTEPTPYVVRLAEPPERPRIEVTARLGGSGLDGALRSAGVGEADTERAVALVREAVGLGSLKAGTEFALVLGRRETKSVPRPLDSLVFRAALDLKLALGRREGGELALTRIPIRVDDTPLRVSGRVGSSLYRAARAAGVPASAVGQFVKLMTFRIDLERDVGARDSYDIVLEHRRAETGETEVGGLLYAALRPVGGKPIELMRWTPSGERPQFFDAAGESVRRGLMQTPVDGARLTSGFGMRRHPLLGFSRFHKGADFGAPKGAPVMAAAAGSVDYAGYHGGHGNYIRLRHRNGLATAYAHLSRFAVRPGARVEQGQVIGYVGSTGLSTGPHLHYEVYVNGRAVNPRAADLPTGLQLTGAELGRFRNALARLRALPPAEATTARPAAIAARDTDGADES